MSNRYLFLSLVPPEPFEDEDFLDDLPIDDPFADFEEGFDDYEGSDYASEWDAPAPIDVLSFIESKTVH